MTNEIVKIDPKEFGIEENVASNIAAQFQPMLDKMVELETEYNDVVTMPIGEADTAKKARELRLKYMKIRTGTLDIHKKQKAFYISGGKFVDGWKNAQEFSSLGKESKLEEIEKYAENLEKERILSVQLDRQEQLSKYDVENVASLDLGRMSDNIWENFLQGTIVNYNAKVEAKRLADEAEKQRLEDEIIERERMKVENDRLKEEAEKAAKELELERKRVEKEREKQRKEAQKIIDEQKEANIAALKKQREEAEKAAKEQAEKLKEEQDKLAAIAAKLKEGQDREAKLLADKLALEELELSKGDADKMKSLVADLKELTTKYSFKSKKHKQLQSSINELISKTVVFAESKM